MSRRTPGASRATAVRYPRPDWIRAGGNPLTSSTRGARTVVAGGQRPPDRRPHPEHVEEPGRDTAARQLLGALAVGGVEALVGDRRDAAEGARPRGQLQECRGRKGGTGYRALRV